MTRPARPAFAAVTGDPVARSLRTVITGVAEAANDDPRAHAISWQARASSGGPRTAHAIELERLEESRRGAQRAQAHAEMAMHRFDEGVRKLATMLAAARDQVVQQAVEHAFELAEEILRHEAATQPEALLAAIQRAVHDLNATTGVTIRLAPSDAERLRTRPIEGCAIVDDPRLQPGDFVVEDADACIDARISDRLAEIRAALGDPASGCAARRPHERDLEAR